MQLACEWVMHQLYQRCLCSSAIIDHFTRVQTERFSMTACPDDGCCVPLEQAQQLVHFACNAHSSILNLVLLDKRSEHRPKSCGFILGLIAHSGICFISILQRLRAAQEVSAMVKGRFTVNPFPDLKLTPSGTDNLHEIAGSILEANIQRYENFLTKEQKKIDMDHWKVLKTKENSTVYSARHHDVYRTGSPAHQHHHSTSGLPSLLSLGTTVGSLEDMMFGVVNPTLEIMRIKASYVDDLSGAAVLANLEESSVEDPFHSLVVKWMELDIPLHTTSLVNNRDYVYVEATGMVNLSTGERVGYHVLHSVNFPQTHELPGRVRASMSICGIFRQIRPNAIEVFVTGVMDPGGDMIRVLVVPSIAAVFLSTLKYVHCGQMKKLAWMLEKKYAEAKELGTPNREHICVTCSNPITNRRIGDFGKSNSTCKLCFGYVCHTCKIERNLSFVTPDLLLARRKVTFCAVCLNSAIHENASVAARAQIVATDGVAKSFQPSAASDASTVSGYSSSLG
ncbi:unnamed protein product [Phytophthora fragariaefolia]|uniref:Unnamed protein product n=1 Tax=Phytophthora fragariaefolia TaxID=1490495 RepID=A0A9W6XTK2_9STRA|nr:unnamed protein product [Phytophthora fragariaefolia]